jgi:pimeloyl-[acyl-carrier protein] synthase
MQHEGRDTPFEPTDSSLSLLRMLEPEILANPYLMYGALREYDPVHWDPYMHAWVVTSYPEVVTVMMTYSADRTPSPAYLDRLGLSFMTPFAEMMLQQMMFMDGAKHARLRTLCASAFTPRRVEGLREVIRSVAESLIDKFIEAGRFDMVVDFANPLPAMVTAKLLGVPEEDHQQLHCSTLLRCSATFSIIRTGSQRLLAVSKILKTMFPPGWTIRRSIRMVV